MHSHNWVAAGDWNVDLDKFASTNIATEAQGQVIGCKEAAISSGNTLDFVLASRSVAASTRSFPSPLTTAFNWRSI